MSDSAGRTGLVVGGAIIGNILLPGGGTLLGAKISGAAIGAMGGAYLGSVLFPTKLEKNMPTMSSYPVQRSNKGTAIPKVFGTTRVAGNIIFMGETHPYTIKHSVGGGGGKGGGGGSDATQEETRYRKSFLIGITKGPARILRAWRGKTEISISDFTSFDGNSNTGIGALIGKDFAEYADLCCAWFDEYDLANSQSIPNFTFEVTSYTSDKIPITSVSDLLAMNDNLDGSNNLIGDYELLSDLDLTGVVVNDGFQGGGGGRAGGLIGGSFGANGLFKGTFDGRGHTISNMDITTNVDVLNGAPWGLFGSTQDATITNLHLRNFTIRCDGKVNKVGLMAGQAGATTFTDCSVEGLITFDAPVLTQLFRIGGFAGGTQASGNCIVNKCSANVTMNMLATFPANSDLALIGGFWGRSSLDVFNDCWCRGSLVNQTAGLRNIFNVGGFHLADGAGERNRCWSAFDFTNTNSNFGTIGGFSSANLGIDVDCYWDEDISGATTDLSDATPKTTSEMKTQSTFDDYAFGSIWKMSGNDGYPALTTSQPSSFDANPSPTIRSLLTNTTGYGASINPALINDATFSEVETYCTNNSLLFSFKIDRQRPVWDWIDYILSHFQGFLYMSNGKFSLGVFKNEAANGSITRDDLIVEAGENPPPSVQVRKRDYTDTSNQIEISWTNRDKDYDVSVVPSNDETDQRISGEVRKRKINLEGITNKELASKLSWRMLYESLYRFSVYTFTLSYKNMKLQVGDVRELSDGFLITEQRIRITSISESKDGRNLDIEAVEDLPYMYVDLTSYEAQDTEHTPDPDFSSLIDSPLYAYREHKTAPLLHLSLTPQNQYTNGWYIYRSFDDVSYELVGKGTIDGVTDGDANSQGTLNSNLPAHTAVVHKKNESFLVDIGTVTDLITTTDADFFANKQLCKIGDEIIGFKIATEISEGVWEVSELIRGLFNTEPVAHVAGDSFKTMSIDFNFAYTDDDVGRTIFFKALTFFGNDIQNISEVSSSSRVIVGNFKRPLPISLARIRYREGKTTYLTDDVVIDWYWNSRTSGFNIGGHGETLWNSFVMEDMIETINVLLEQTDGTDILEESLETDPIGEPLSLFVPESDRNGNNPIIVTLTPGSTLPAPESRSITIEKI